MTSTSYFYLSIIKYIKNPHFANLLAMRFFRKWNSRCHLLQKSGVQSAFEQLSFVSDMTGIEFLKHFLIGRNKCDHVAIKKLNKQP